MILFKGIFFLLLLAWFWFGVGFVGLLLVVAVLSLLQILIRVRFCGDTNKSHNFMLFGANLSVSHSHYCHFAKSSKP